MSAASLGSIEAFEGATLRDVAAAVLALAFPEGRQGRWAMTGEGTVDEAVLSTIPGVRGGSFGFVASPAVLTARMVAAEGVQALEASGLVIVRYGANDTYTLILTRRGAEALASGDPAVSVAA